MKQSHPDGLAGRAPEIYPRAERDRQSKGIKETERAPEQRRGGAVRALAVGVAGGCKQTAGGGENAKEDAERDAEQGARRRAWLQSGSRTRRTSSGRAPALARSSEVAAYNRPAADSPRSLTGSGDGDDRAGDLVVDGLFLRVAQLPQPADRPDDADR